MIVYKGIDFFFIYEITGNRPPATLPAKATYLFKDIERIRDFYGIPLFHPAVSINSVTLDFQLCKHRPIDTELTQAGGVGEWESPYFSVSYHDRRVFNCVLKVVWQLFCFRFDFTSV